jgi:hypothetical protein
MQQAKQQGVLAFEHVERVRDATEGIFAAIRTNDAGMVVIGATSEPEDDEGHEAFHRLVEALLSRAPCEVIFGRQKPKSTGP